jgi:hypothetical protein
MKKALMAFVGLGMVFGCAVSSFAIPFTEALTDTHNFSSPRKFKGSDYVAVGDKSPFAENYGLDFDAGVADVKSGSVTIYYTQVSPKSRAEQWTVFAGDYELGHLVGGPSSKWLSQTFTLRRS